MKHNYSTFLPSSFPAASLTFLVFQVPCWSQNINSSTTATLNKNKTYYQLVHQLEEILERPSAGIRSQFSPSYQTNSVTINAKGGLVITNYLDKKAVFKFSPILGKNIQDVTMITAPSSITDETPSAYAAVIQLSNEFSVTKLLPTPTKIDVPSKRTGMWFKNQSDAKEAIELINSIKNCTTHNIDWKFLASPNVEGSTLEGVWPGELSGITIATGIDLAQQGENRIKSWPIPTELKNKLLPYSVPKGAAADEFIKTHPHLFIKKEEAELLDSIVQGEEVPNLVSIYNSATQGASFVELPTQAQTVIFSLYHQYGSSLPLPNRGQKFWKAVTSQQWDVAQKELLNYDGLGKTPRYSLRRKTEAAFLARIGTTDIIP